MIDMDNELNANNLQNSQEEPMTSEAPAAENLSAENLPATDADVNTSEEVKESKPEKPHRLFYEIFDWLEMFVIAFSAVMLLFIFVGRHSPVDGGSMLNTLHEGDVLIVSDLFYTPENGDIVVFQSMDTGFDQPYVKRVIATEGQVVDINFETWTVTVDGKVLPESYVNREGGSMLRGSLEYPFTVPEGKVFCMGDNRNHSKDSRDASIGAVDTRYILGRAIFRVFPFSAIGTLN